MFIWLIVAMGVIGFGAAGASAADVSGHFSISLLENPLWPIKGNEAASSVELNLVVRGGKAEESAYAMLHYPGRSHHGGKVIEFVQDGGKVRISAELTITRSGDIEGGQANFIIELQEKDGTWEGAYHGTFQGKAHSGSATARVWPGPRDVAAFVAPEAGEHPRLLVRKSELPDLRRKAQTTQGKAIVEKLRDALDRPSKEWGAIATSAAGHATLYAATGELREALVAQALLRDSIETELDWQNTEKRGRGALEVSRLVREIALTYDLCYDAWDKPFRVSIARDLNARAATLTGTGRGFINDPASTWQAVTRSVGGLSALAVYGDSQWARDPTDEPSTRPAFDPTKLFEPPPGLKVGRGVPVVKFEHDVMPARWLVAGPFPRVEDKLNPAAERVDLLSPLGGMEHAAPEMGTWINYRDIGRRFAMVDAKAIVNYSWMRGHPQIDLLQVCDRASYTTCFFYTVLENDRPRYVKFQGGGGNMWFAGQRVRGDVLHLAPGLYPVLVQGNLGNAERPGSATSIQPRFQEVGEDEALAAAKPAWDGISHAPMQPEEVQARMVRVAQVAVARYLALAKDKESVAEPMGRGLGEFDLACRNVIGKDLLTGTLAEGMGTGTGELAAGLEALIALRELKD